MRVDWQHDENAPIGRVIDLETGLPVSGDVLWADEETGEYGILLRDWRGLLYVDTVTGEIAQGTCRGRIHIDFSPPPLPPA